MAARRVDGIYITNFIDTGLTTPMTRYRFTLEIKWYDAEDVARTHGPQQYTFPNDLADMPDEIKRAFAEKMIIAKARVALGVDTWEQYL
jgi:hypothetical protein